MPVYGTTVHCIDYVLPWTRRADYDLSLSPAPSLLITLASLVFRPPIGRGRARRPGEEPAVMKLNILLLRNEPEGRAGRCSLSLSLSRWMVLSASCSDCRSRVYQAKLHTRIVDACFERVAVYFIFLISTHKGTSDVKV